MLKKVQFWFDNARPTSLPQSILPAATAIFLAIHTDGFVWWLAILALLGVAFAHLGLNLFDDYFDTKKKKQTYREELQHTGMRARIGKTPYLTSGQATENQLLVACFVFCGIAVAIGCVIFLFRDINIFWLAVTTAIIGIQYSAPPLRLSYHGLGEVVIGIIFGSLNMIGLYYASCGSFSYEMITLSFSIGLLVMNIVYIHSILDFIPDKAVGKRTLAVLLNNQKAMLVLLFFIIFIPFLIIIAGIFLKILGLKYLAVFILLPMAITLFYMMTEFVRNPERKFEPKFWLGPFNQWKKITEYNLEWFMVRWLTARNLISFFCLIIIILTFF
ncbi:MAG: prenyltransferase [Prevotellaceae bacterium]|jgi:1,4-dihydroxy-2-naphthoate octaprenyltransferase|nr:prenyltransferase [Prevotellaceae bacterium]